MAVAAVALALVAGCDDGDSDTTGDTVAPATDGAATEPPATDSAASDVPPSDVPSTEPVASDPPVDEPPATDGAGSDVQVTEPVASDPPVSEPPATDGPSDAPPDLSFLWNDVETFVAAWGATNAILAETDPGVVPVVLTVEDLRIEAMPSVGDGFSATEVEPAGYIAGTIDPGGEVSAIVTTVDPSAERAQLFLATSMLTLVEVWADLDTDEFLSDVEAAYLSLEVDAATRVGEQAFVAGPFGTPYSAALTVIDGGGGALVEVAVIPVDDEQLALSIVEVLRTEMTGLLT